MSAPLAELASAPPELSGDGAKEASTTSLPSPGISVEFHGHDEAGDERPLLFGNLSAPAAPQHFQSPIRQHKRTPSAHREIKETLNARSEYTSDENDGRSHHVINQYTIKEEIGRGSYGAVHLATDQFGNEYAVKEFSKTRLRKRVQSNILRLGPRRPGRFPPRGGFGGAKLRMADHEANEAKDALFLIREEIAIMKKLNHPNLVQLIEVLDDPEEDSLYMVLEMCKKGVIMKVGLGEPADPYSEEECRCWFRDLILGIEYLHAHGVVHRDIKPDNLLLTDDDVLKIVDFGVSEMFEKPENMRTAKSAGSPAFLPPELCVAKHGDVSGTAADIWSMGVSLYCLRYGRIPFERIGVLEMYEAIKTETAQIPSDESKEFVDLMRRLLEKDPTQRITMAELREHPWVTKGGHDSLLSVEENCEYLVEPPNALEVNHAFTRRMSHLLCVMKAISRFKSLLTPKDVLVLPQEPIPKPDVEKQDDGDDEATPRQSLIHNEPKPQDTDGKTSAEYVAKLLKEREAFLGSSDSMGSSQGRNSLGERGHAHDPTDVEPLFLGIGTGGGDDFVKNEEPSTEIVSDSPTAVDFNIYDHAFSAEVDRIRRSSSRRSAKKGSGTSKMYLTKHLKGGEQYNTDEDIAATERLAGDEGEPPSGGTSKDNISSKFASVVAHAIDKAEGRNSQG